MTEEGRALLFGLGVVVATSGAAEVLGEDGGSWRLNAVPLLTRHQEGDWGDVPSEDARENARSVEYGWRVMSSYEVAGERLWIITEADRSSACVLLPSEY